MKDKTVIYENLEQWMAKGKELFGDDQMKWQFECPSCGKIRTPEDFRPYKDKGADPNSAYKECLGRYTGGRKGPDKCDWAAYGLFRGPNIVKNNGEEVAVFRFAGELNGKT